MGVVCGAERFIFKPTTPNAGVLRRVLGLLWWD